MPVVPAFRFVRPLSVPDRMVAGAGDRRTNTARGAVYARWRDMGARKKKKPDFRNEGEKAAKLSPICARASADMTGIRGARPRARASMIAKFPICRLLRLRRRVIDDAGVKELPRQGMRRIDAWVKGCGPMVWCWKGRDLVSVEGRARRCARWRRRAETVSWITALL